MLILGFFSSLKSSPSGHKDRGWQCQLSSYRDPNELALDSKAVGTYTHIYQGNYILNTQKCIQLFQYRENIDITKNVIQHFL